MHAIFLDLSVTNMVLSPVNTEIHPPLHARRFFPENPHPLTPLFLMALFALLCSFALFFTVKEISPVFAALTKNTRGWALATK
jgi:hypothetical protein